MVFFSEQVGVETYFIQDHFVIIQEGIHVLKFDFFDLRFIKNAKFPGVRARKLSKKLTKLVYATVICLAGLTFASSRLGTVTFKIPSVYLAVIFPPSTLFSGREKLRWND